MYVPRSINVRRQVMRFFKEACRNKSNYTRYNETPVQTKQEQSTQIQCIIRSMNICRLVIRSKRQTRGNISNYIAGFQHVNLTSSSSSMSSFFFFFSGRGGTKFNIWITSSK